MIKIIFLISFITINSYSNEILFNCENGFSYKISQNNDSFYKNDNKIWKKIDKVNILENKYEFLIPNSTYQSCSNKELPKCYYNTVINYHSDQKKANVREIIRNDCFIGTMGCNNYPKGLEINQKRCRVKD